MASPIPSHRHANLGIPCRRPVLLAGTLSWSGLAGGLRSGIRRTTSRPVTCSGKARTVGQHPQAGHPDHRHDILAVGGDTQVLGPSGKLTHVGGASAQEKMTDVAITIFPCTAGTFAYPDLTKRSQDHTSVNTQG